MQVCVVAQGCHPFFSKIRTVHGKALKKPHVWVVSLHALLEGRIYFAKTTHTDGWYPLSCGRRTSMNSSRPWLVVLLATMRNNFVVGC